MRKCRECNLEFTSKLGSQRYCTKECKDKATIGNFICTYCNKSFTAIIKPSGNKLCSRKCANYSQFTKASEKYKIKTYQAKDIKINLSRPG